MTSDFDSSPDALPSDALPSDDLPSDDLPSDALPSDEWKVTSLDSGKRLDRVLSDHYPDLHSRTYLTGLIETGFVLLNGKQVKKRTLVREGELIEILFALRPELSLAAEKMDFNILYEDPYLLAINKPADLVVHPAPGHWSGTFVHGLLYHCQQLTLSKENIRPGIVHRLDKGTTGVLLAAKQPLAHERLIAAFANRQVKKQYLAICIGNPGSGELSTLLSRDPTCRTRIAVMPGETIGARLAVTRYRTLMTHGGLSLVAMELLTGRTHQARVHMKHLHSPILGDPLYGHPAANQRYLLGRQMLHAHQLHLAHPITASPLHFIAPIPDDMQLLLEKSFPGYNASMVNISLS